VSFTINPANAMVSDGALTAEKVKQGGAAAATWLPAGELLVPVTIGSAEGKVVVDKLSYPGAEIAGLTLTFSKGKLTGMTATSGLESLKALYDPAGGGKDVLSFIDLGLNPEVKLPTNTGRLVWMAAGGVTLGMGDNRGWGGTNASDFTIALPLASATVSIDGKPIVENGTLK
jgi:leucyl aminopeptidase (aminopeptidase T)